jgi:hypothetical protein
LVERAESKIAPALDVNGGEIHAVERINQEIAQVLDYARIKRLRRVGGQVAQEAIRTAVGREVSHRHEEGVLQLQARSGDCAVFAQPLGFR